MHLARTLGQTLRGCPETPSKPVSSFYAPKAVKRHEKASPKLNMHAMRTIVSADALNDIAREVSIYDSQVRTGNEALDTILTEKGLACARAGIAFSCMADGGLLSAIPDTEIYSLFGNILDNAIEAVQKVNSGERRRISLVVRRRGDMVSIHEENFCSGRLVFRDGLPQTTKAQPSEHGYGTKSIRAVTERCGGTLSMRAEGEQFLLDILLPEG